MKQRMPERIALLPLVLALLLSGCTQWRYELGTSPLAIDECDWECVTISFTEDICML